MNFFLVLKSQDELPCLLEAPRSPAPRHFQILALALYQTAMGTRMIMKTNQCMKLNKNLPGMFSSCLFLKVLLVSYKLPCQGFQGKGKLGSAASTLTFQGQALKLWFPFCLSFPIKA